MDPSSHTITLCWFCSHCSLSTLSSGSASCYLNFFKTIGS
uniref:Uncharacterized protein n=1 Tax=Arundo donax TaxID=35708 RepID=A0A0A8YBP6_ARUDO